MHLFLTVLQTGKCKRVTNALVAKGSLLGLKGGGRMSASLLLFHHDDTFMTSSEPNHLLKAKNFNLRILCNSRVAYNHHENFHPTVRMVLGCGACLWLDRKPAAFLPGCERTVALVCSFEAL